jgi:ABC-2 type transport system ATP-binding protein
VYKRQTHIAFLDRGRITETGTPDQIKAKVPGRLFEVACADPRRALAAISPIAGVESAHLLGDLVRVLWTGAEDPQISLQPTLSALPGPVELRAATIDMETVFSFLAERRAAVTE